MNENGVGERYSIRSCKIYICLLLLWHSNWNIFNKCLYIIL